MLDVFVDSPPPQSDMVVGLLISPYFRATLTDHSFSLFPQFAEMNEQACKNDDWLFN